MNVYCNIINKARKWTQPECPSVDKQPSKMWYICTVEFYSAKKRNEVLINATTWMNLENIMLSEKKPVKRRKILYESIHIKCPEEANPQKQRVDQ